MALMRNKLTVLRCPRPDATCIILQKSDLLTEMVLLAKSWLFSFKKLSDCTSFFPDHWHRLTAYATKRLPAQRASTEERV